MMKLNINVVLVSMCLLSPAVMAAEPLAFQGVMRDLGKHMQTVAGAIANEDWLLVEKTAHLIGEHPKPSVLERARIFAFVGSNLGKFKEFDKQTHEGAHEMAHAAAEKDGVGVINALQKVQLGCLGCHQNFRAGFVKHFYSK
jgi:cytochrome c556